MSDLPTISDECRGLIDGYLEETLDAEQFARLEEVLRQDEDARRYFVTYCRTHADLHEEARARRAADRALGGIAPAPLSNQREIKPPGDRRIGSRWRPLAIAAGLILAVALTWRLAHRPTTETAGAAEVAWLANAQDCRWAADAAPEGGLRPGRVIRLERGLAEVRFRSGARVLIEGPAAMEPLSGNSARLLSGKLSARVPDSAKGFQVIAPQGRVVDLGTEFGISVGDDGGAEVVVFSGKVEAYAAAGGGATPLTEKRSARINSGGVVVAEAGSWSSTGGAFARRIRPAPFRIPRSLSLDFHSPIPESLRDMSGAGTGFRSRLPGTGAAIAANDPNLRLDPAAGTLELTTTRSDINTQFQLDRGEYPGVALSSLGFTGREDFEITAVVANIPALAAVGQFGLYAGERSDRNIRGGLISRRVANEYKQFLVNNDGGRDHDSLYVGVFPTGSDIRVTLRRLGGKYTMSVESLSGAGAASTLSIRHPAFLDELTEMHVGLFAANTGSDERATIIVREFKVTVYTEQPE